MAVFRREHSVAIVWRQYASESDDEFVADIAFVESDGRYLVDHALVYRDCALKKHSDSTRYRESIGFLADGIDGMKCIYLSMDSLEDFVSDADLSVPAMEALGWSVEKRSWRDRSVDWDDCDLVYVCTPWDYHEHLDEFLEVLERIDASRALLVNDLPTIRWNAIKTYLRDLQQRGVAVVPTRWHDELTEDCLTDAFSAFGADRIVIKPLVGANALDTHVLEAGSATLTVELSRAYRGRPFMLQPFLDSVQRVGEYSLFFFDGEYSHAILKVPQRGDFRTQEEHGSDIRPHDPSDPLLTLARRVVGAIEPGLAYARADFVADDDDGFLLMELELIEPSLYFRTDPASPERFATAITNVYRRETGL